MSENPINSGFGAAQSASQGANSNGQSGGQAAQPGGGQRQDVTPNPRSEGHSPARAARQQSAGGTPAEQKIKLGEVEYSETQVRDALKSAAERDIRQRSLPADPNGYEVKLPENFKAPEGLAFQFDQNDPALAEFKRIAHAHGLDPTVFQDALGAYASTEIKKLQQTNSLIAKNRERLGSAVDARLAAVDQWMTAIAGDKAKPMIAALKQYPVVDTVEALETIIRRFSNQGGAEFSQSHREQQGEQGKIPDYENMSFTQRRAAQDALNTRGGPRR